MKLLRPERARIPNPRAGDLLTPEQPEVLIFDPATIPAEIRTKLLEIKADEEGPFGAGSLGSYTELMVYMNMLGLVPADSQSYSPDILKEKQEKIERSMALTTELYPSHVDANDLLALEQVAWLNPAINKEFLADKQGLLLTHFDQSLVEQQFVPALSIALLLILQWPELKEMVVEKIKAHLDKLITFLNLSPAGMAPEIIQLCVLLSDRPEGLKADPAVLKKIEATRLAFVSLTKKYNRRAIILSSWVKYLEKTLLLAVLTAEKVEVLKDRSLRFTLVKPVASAPSLPDRTLT